MADLKLTANALLNLDTNALFEKHNIEEIRKVEKDTRFQIEKKKQDLRLMVGERYRDLIEAADTIADMGRCAQNIVSAVQGMQEYCTDLQKTHMTKGLSGDRSRLSKQRNVPTGFYSIASQIKLLVDMPEKIWSAIEGGELLWATQLFLLSRHIVSSLQLDANTQKSAQILSWFPILSRQWAAISHFKTSILQSCRSVLKDAKMSEQATAKALCSILLLEDSTPRQVFTEFLLARKSAVQQLFQPYQPGSSIKSQVCGVIELICTTVQQIYGVFYNSEDENKEHCNLLMKIIQDVTNDTKTGSSDIFTKDMGSGSFAKYLPVSVTDFRPVLRTLASPISAEYLQKSCLEWIDTCIHDINIGVGKLFTYVTTIKGLTGIRDALWELLSQDNYVVPWKTVCLSVISKQLSPWDEFIRPLFLTRAQTIIQNMLDGSTDSTQRLVNQVLQDIASLPTECNVASFIWTETANDAPTTSIWSTSLASRAPTEGGGLYMKSRAFSPRVQSLSSTIDSRLKALLEDVAYYTTAEEEKKADERIVGPFDKFADSSNLLTFLQMACAKCIDRLLHYINQQLNEAEKFLEDSGDEQNQNKTTVINRALLLGRLCAALCDLTPNLRQCMLGVQAKEAKAEPIRPLGRRALSLRQAKSKAAAEPTEWDKMKTLFTEYCNKAYNVWIQSHSKDLVTKFKNVLLDENGNTALRMATNWEEISIQEETEAGKTVTSTIKLPVQASWYVQSTLCKLCEEINRVGGHALPRPVVQGLISRTSDGMLSAYESVLSKGGEDKSTERAPLSQAKALQLLFDLKFINTLMSGRKEDEKETVAYAQRVQNLTESLESRIDPFDLDVFTPHMQSNLSRHTMRCAVLLGALSSTDKPTYTHRPVQSGHHEQHNVLPLTPGQGRFSLLPLSTTHTGYGSSQSLLSKQQQLTTPSLELITRSSFKSEETSSNDTASSLYSKLGSFRSSWLS
ncbi:conserved oligomeric Golgi complex subunit 1-like isoform X2 [Ptychodera flava]|uniref:conserved oligomeric Golgi complex subunit 1-like isoform X2 n=1 Tax=Ptychodera flava TaxID=63121 RepID=UPI00396A3C83